MTETPPPSPHDPDKSARRVALLLCPDLMFAVRLQSAARAAGMAPQPVKPGAPLPAGDVLVVDLATRGDWASAIAEAASRGMPVVAFGPHMDAEARRRAKEAGATRVLTNSNLGRDLLNTLKEIG